MQITHITHIPDMACFKHRERHFVLFLYIFEVNVDAIVAATTTAAQSIAKEEQQYTR